MEVCFKGTTQIQTRKGKCTQPALVERKGKEGMIRRHSQTLHLRWWTRQTSSWIYLKHGGIEQVFVPCIGVTRWNLAKYRLTCLVNCSSHSLQSVKNFCARMTFLMKPEEASLTRMMICRSGTIMATVRNMIFKFSGNSCRPAYPGFCKKRKVNPCKKYFIFKYRSQIQRKKKTKTRFPNQ